MLLSSMSSNARSSSAGCGGLISRQASTGHLAEEKKLKKLAEKKSARSKRCKSLLMLSSPFSSSTTSSMKSSLLSLLHPNQNHKQQNQETDQVTPRRFKQRLSASSTTVAACGQDDIKTSCNMKQNYSPTISNADQNSRCRTPDQTRAGGQTHSASQQMRLAADEATNNGACLNDSATKVNTPARSAKCVKMKLFEQPLDKLFSPKAMKQLNNAINANSPSSLTTATATTTTTSLTTALGKRKRSSSQTASTAATNACLRKLFSSNADPNNNNSTLTSQSQVKQMLLSVLPEPIRNLLIELYLRGPSTVGIFRKSPNAKHCKELRQKLESDSQSSIQQFQVTVIASVFKEWLRSLPDCLLMSRLYHQWIDVAKLMEPLYQHRQQSPHHQSQTTLDESLYSNTSGCNTSCDNTMMQTMLISHGNVDSTSNATTTHSKTSETTPTTPTSLRPSRSPLTDNGQLTPSLQPLDRAHSCSTMLMSSSTSEFAINKLRCDSTGSTSWTSSDATTINGTPNTAPTMSAFALSERHSECLRIVRQLLDALNEPNLILLRSFICILWHIAQNSDHNKMSANNLGVCVGQSLLNDEHQPNGGAANISGGSSTFSKRHRRARSQCLLSSTLSLTSSTSMLQNAYLDTSGAQETAKYVPILVAFMIENAPELFGQDIEDIFGDCSVVSHHKLDIKSHSVDLGCTQLVGSFEGAQKSTNTVSNDSEHQQNQLTPGRSSDQVDAGTAHHRVNCASNSAVVCKAATPKEEMGDDGQRAEIRNCHQQSALNQLPSKQQEDANRRESSPKRRQITVEATVFQSSDHHQQQQQCDHKQQQQCDHKQQHLLLQPDDGKHGCNITGSISNANRKAQTATSANGKDDDDRSTSQPRANTTSILIVNSTPQKRHQHHHHDQDQQHRPLSATESTSSSRASSSTSGVHSESSNASSSGSDSSSTGSVHNGRESDVSGSDANTVSSPSPSPSTVSSPSATSSTSCSPTQEDQQKHLSSTSPCTLPSSGESSMEHHHDPKSHGGSRLLPELQELVATRHHQQQEKEADPGQSALNAKAPRFHNSHLLNNRYSTFTGILNRVPKIPVQFTTSSYGGEAVIYNPKPRHFKSIEHFYTSVPIENDENNSLMAVPSKESVISTIKQSAPYCSKTNARKLNQMQQPQPLPRQQHQRASIPANSQHELRLERLNEFLAHQNHQQQQQNQPLVSAPSSLAYLPQANYVSLHPAPVAVSRVQQQQHLKQQSMAVYPSAASEQQQQKSNPIASYQQQQPQHQLQQHPIFYSTANLSSIQQLQQRDHYLLYHRASLNPQRSHVMSLRDYYLSLQLQNQERQQQQQITYRNRLHSQQQRTMPADTINKFHPSSQQPQQHPHQQRQYLVGYQHQHSQQQPLRSLQTNANNLGAQLTTHHAIQTRPQTRLAKIRQNQFNGIYVNNKTTANDCSVIVPNQMSSANVAQQKVVVKPMSSSSSNHSSDIESDESMNESWMESTMV